MQLRTIKKVVQPYSALAPIYDQVMEHVDYEHWASYVHKVLQRFDKKAEWIADISCGTGSCCGHLLELGYRVVGSDSSLSMLKHAYLKAAKQQWNLNVYCADMCRQPLKKQCDAIISLYDSMNYLISDRAWLHCLKDAFTILNPGGLFIFDVSTLRNSMQEFSNYRQKDKVESGAYVRESTFNRESNVQENYFEIKRKDSPGTIFCETHRQVIRPLDEIISFIQLSPFELLGGFKNFTFESFSEISERVHFVLQKN